MDRWIELKRFYEDFTEEGSVIANLDNYGFTFSDELHHIYMCITNEYSDNEEEYEWFIELNNVIDGGHEPVEVASAPINDGAALMLQIAYFIDRYLGEEISDDE